MGLDRCCQQTLILIYLMYLTEIIKLLTACPDILPVIMNQTKAFLRRKCLSLCKNQRSQNWWEVGKYIKVEMLRRWQAEYPAYKEMVAWITMWSTNPQGSQTSFNMWYKSFHLENSILMYLSHLSNLSPVEVIPRSNIRIILSKYYETLKQVMQIKKYPTVPSVFISSGY